MAASSVPPATTRDHCLTYLGMGWGLVNLIPKTKRPRDEGWPDIPITDVAGLSRFQKGDNVGVILGKASRFLIDTDGDAPEVAPLSDLLPGTRCAFGRHDAITHWFHYLAQHVEGFTEWIGYAYNSREKLIELRYQGRQTMLPGSVHPDGDRPFWITWPPPQPTVVDLRDLENACRVIAAIILIKRAWPLKGSRDDYAMACVGGLVFHRVDPEQARMMVARAAQLAGDEQWKSRGDSAERADRKVKSADKVRGFPWLEKEFDLPGWGRHLLDTLGVASQGVRVPDGPPRVQPRTTTDKRVQPARRAVLRPWVPFPCEYLPPVMRELVVCGARAKSTDPALIALPALTAAAACIGAAYQVCVNDDWLEECCIWTIPICESGTRKTPAYSLAMRWLNQEQQRIIREHKAAKRAYKAALADWTDGPKPEKPGRPQVVLTSDGTIEAVILALSENVRGIVYASEEARDWFSSFTRYSQDSMAQYLSLYNGVPVQSLRVTTDERSAARPVLGVSGAIQPAILADALTNQLVYSGMLGRALMGMPPPTRNRLERRPPGIQAAITGWLNLCAALRALPWADLETETPRVIAVDDLAFDVYQDWHHRLDDRLFDAPQSAVTIADNKLYGNVIRLALVHHLCTAVAGGHDVCQPIGVESIRAAMALGDWFSNEHARLYPYLESGQATATMLLTDRIRAYFSRRPGVTEATVRELTMALNDKSGEINAESIMEALTILQSEGYGTCTTSLVGGRTRVTFSLTQAPPETPTPEDDG